MAIGAQLMYNHTVMELEAALDSTFHALASSTRRRMLAALAAGDATAGQLGKPFSISQPAASKHIRILEQARLVTRRVDGRLHLFRLEPRTLEQAELWIARHRALWNNVLDSLGDFLDAKAAEGSR